MIVFNAVNKILHGFYVLEKQRIISANYVRIFVIIQQSVIIIYNEVRADSQR